MSFETDITEKKQKKDVNNTKLNYSTIETLIHEHIIQEYKYFSILDKKNTPEREWIHIQGFNMMLRQ